MQSKLKPPMCPMPQLLRKYATHHAIIRLSIFATKNATTVSWNNKQCEHCKLTCFLNGRVCYGDASMDWISGSLFAVESTVEEDTCIYLAQKTQ